MRIKTRNWFGQPRKMVDVGARTHLVLCQNFELVPASTKLVSECCAVGDRWGRKLSSPRPPIRCPRQRNPCTVSVDNPMTPNAS